MDARSVTATAHPARRRRILASPALAIAALAVAGLGSAVLAADASVSISSFAFHPNAVTIDVGDTVTWTNEDQINHTATADGGSFNTGGLGNGESGSVTFDTAGTFDYHCSIHPQMTGTVVVQGAAATPPSGGGTPPTDAATPAESAPSVNGAGLLAIVAAAGAAFGFAVRRIGRNALR